MKKGLACLAYSQKYITLYKSTLENEKQNLEKNVFNEIHDFLIAF